MQDDFKCPLVVGAGPSASVRLLSLCRHRTHALNKCIQSFMFTNATLKFENTIQTRCSISTIRPFDSINSQKNAHKAFVILIPQIGLKFRRQSCLQIASRGPVTPNIAPSGLQNKPQSDTKSIKYLIYVIQNSL